jgi:hypothetical protein
LKAIEAAAEALKLRLEKLEMRNAAEMNQAFVAATQGYGCGLKLIDVAGGGLRACPEVQTGASGGYARFRWAIPSCDRDKMLVKTADGWLLWDLTTNISNWFCPLELEPLHFGGGCLWATLADDPTALLRYAVAI